MADIIELRPKGTELLERYRYLLKQAEEMWWPGNAIPELIPLDDLPALRGLIEASLRPASWDEVGKATAVLLGSFKIGADLLEHRPTFALAMKAELARYPADILDQTIKRARRDPKFRFVPSIGEMVEICDKLLGERRELLGGVNWMEQEHRRRREGSRKGQSGNVNRPRRPSATANGAKNSASASWRPPASHCRRRRSSSPSGCGRQCTGRSGKRPPGTRAWMLARCGR
jgi:hypothetical protein